MSTPAKKLPSVYEQFLAQPPHVVAEIINGVLTTQARPAARHAYASSVLGSELMGPFHRGRGGPGGWIILDEPELHLGENILVPDMAGWRRDRMPDVPDVTGFELPPDWLCEVLSPSTQATDRADKLPIYAKHGVRHAWLLDPIARTLEVYRLESGLWALLGTHRDAALAPSRSMRSSSS